MKPIIEKNIYRYGNIFEGKSQIELINEIIAVLHLR